MYTQSLSDMMKRKALKEPTGFCYEDGSGSNRLLPHDVMRDKGLTIQKCILHCSEKKYKFAGVQTGHECWCGNDSPPKNKIRSKSDCSVRCSGDHDQKCGGIWRINVFDIGKSLRVHISPASIG